MTHLIRQQYIHVDLQGSESEGFALQNRLSDLCNAWLNQAIERILDRCAPPGGRLCIDRLELDAGTLTLDNIEHSLTEAVAQALEKALLEQIPPGEAFSSPGSGGDANTRLKNDRQAATEAFIYFLETGRLPWSFRLPAGVSFEQFLTETWKPAQGGDSAPAPVTQWSRALSAPQALQRLMLQFSEAFLHELLQQMSPQAHASVARIFAAVRSASAVSLPGAEIRPVFEKQLWEAAFRQAARAVVAGEIELIAFALAARPETISFILPALKDVLRPADLPEFVRQLATHSAPAFPALTPLLERQLNTLFKPLSPEIQALLKTGAASSRTSKPRSRGKANASSSAPDATETAHISISKPGKTQTPETFPEEGIYVDNAGLVILHPFLQMFFENLGIAHAGALAQPDRALHLLHFLCTGQTPAPEYELVLPKILCNIPLEDPVEFDIVLTDQEKDESTTLLTSAIRWWEALRNTSPDALRGTFLCRPGKLSVRGDGDWLLQVERQSYDILLDHLPWGISAVKLPWMERILWVEWG